MKKGKIRSLSKDVLNQLVINSISLSEILRALNLDTSSGNFRTLKRKLFDDQINYDHIKNGPGYQANRINSFRKAIPLSEVLITNSYYNTTNLKARLIKENLLVQKCQICNLKAEWNNSPLCLQLDHINGVSSDNRLENLRLLCPNCHSQTSTYAARNKVKKNKLVKIKRIQQTKINWPADNELIIMLNATNYVKVALNLGVSDTAIRKRLRRKGFNPKDFT